MKLVDAKTMTVIDTAASADLGASHLMQNAGAAIADLVAHISNPCRIVAFAGPGNNGGDAFAACAELHPAYSCIIYAAENAAPSEARADAQQRAIDAGVEVRPLPNSQADGVHALVHALVHADVILDGFFGVGARPNTQAYAHIIQAINSSRARCIALDIPTGMSADNGKLADPIAVRAHYTLMLGLPKYGIFLSPARDYAGELWFAGIGTAEWDEVHPSEFHQQNPPMHLLTLSEAISMLPQRPTSSDKRISGAPLILAGSAQYPGAAVLCAQGAARMGAGYVTVGTPTGAEHVLRNHLVEQVVFGFDENDIATSVEVILKHAKSCSSIAMGPGMSMSESTGEILRAVVQQTDLPLVIDASALHHFHRHLELLRHRKCVLTPHASEFTRLTDSQPFNDDERPKRLQEFVSKSGITTLLKGNATLIADGIDMHLNSTGTNALATAGTGDTLTGMIATLLSQRMEPVDAARLGAYIHGLAGQAAQADRVRGIMAGDLPEHFRHVWHAMEQVKASHRAPYALQRLDSID